ANAEPPAAAAANPNNNPRNRRPNRRPIWPFDIFMPLALLVINPHQHLRPSIRTPTSALRTGRFLKGVYFKMQASFMLLCGNRESHVMTNIDCIFAEASSVSSRFLSQYVKVCVDE
ncbi:hypothetical protein, partial [Nitrobacter sp.]|uniref:hypothetical protein n=1 Tax=Nitrobacter sp. TaxID=29420 RepID=UPI0029CAAC79